MKSVLNGQGIWVPRSRRHVEIYFIQKGHCERPAGT